MLIACPDCERKVSDRAKACPDCGLPVAEWVAERAAERALADARKTRERLGEVDCPACDARGFTQQKVQTPDGVETLFGWCTPCKHSGRVHQCRDSSGVYAVSHAALDRFLAGTLDPGGEGVWHLGDRIVEGHRYPQAGAVHDDDRIEFVTVGADSSDAEPSE